MNELRYSRQREALMQCLSGRRDHPTADTVYRELRQQHPHISLGTVYRNLSLLEGMGELRRISGGDGAEHYDPNLTPHDHFICRSCGRIIDLPSAELCGQDPSAWSDAIGRVESHSLTWYGQCRDCGNAGK